MITPIGKQREVLALEPFGHTVVLGTAGSGKTIIAILRAKYLANLPRGGKVLLLTFNRALVEYMRSVGDCPQNLTVENYHKFARGYLNYRGKMPQWDGIVSNEEREELISKALKEIAYKYPLEATLKRSETFFLKEIQFIQEFGCDSLEKYQIIERTGRSESSLRREKRVFVYEVYQKYCEIRKEKGHEYDWFDLAMYAYKELLEDKEERRYTHIVIDEGQDFSPMMIKSLTAAIPVNGSFTFFGDVAQQIYGNRISWRESGISTEHVWRFEVNYRNPKTVVDFASELTSSSYWKKNDDMVACREVSAMGPKPILMKFDSNAEETEWVVGKAISESKKASTVIICRNRTDVARYSCLIQGQGVQPVIIDKDHAGFPERKQLYLSTYHAVKGLEFYNVFIPEITNQKMPDQDALEREEEKDEAITCELKLFYVAVTRTKYALFMSFSGDLSPLFPVDSDKYERRDM